MAVTITTVCENSVHQRGLLGEHGFSALIEAGQKRILFDTGAGETLIRNAGTLGIDLAGIDAVVLSHGHDDHTGGLTSLLNVAHPGRIVAHPNVFLPKYSKTASGYAFKGIPAREELEDLGAVFDLRPDWSELFEGVFVSGEVRRTRPVPKQPFYLEGKGGMELDGFTDDLSLVVETAQGPVIILGCAHAGVQNILEHVAERSGRDRIYGVLGGMHLARASKAYLQEVAAALESFGVEFIAPGHCTGFYACSYLAQRFQERFHLYSVGAVFKFQ